jgi:DNA repair exonuclease SbcCD ATPase subunit
VRVLVDDIITKANESWNNQKETIISQLMTKKQENIESLTASLVATLDLKNAIEKSNRIKELAEKITKESDTLKRIEEKEKAKVQVERKLETLINEVANSYVSLRSEYESFAAYIKENSLSGDSGLQYDVQIPFRKNEFISKWSELYRANAPQNRSLLNVDNFTAENYTKELLSQIIIMTLNGELTTLKAGADTEQALRNILDDWYNIKYIVRMGNDSIDVMSPGKKALVLLQLLIDLADSECPILIDQPEDDLDNRSIFEQLIPFIKRKKVNRQIIVVTHNANIVIGADAELVIVANQDGIDAENKSRRFEYRSGSIENDYPVYKTDGTKEKGVLNQQGIQQHICDILEGGVKAFEKRKNKYKFLKSERI